MPQILNTGAGLYQPVQGSSYDPIAAIREAGAEQASIAKYGYDVRKQREADFLKSIDIKTENMLYSTLQGEAAKRIKGVVEEATKLWKNSGENPTMEDQLKIATMKRDYEQWQADRLDNAKRLVEKKKLVYEDNGNLFDFNDSQELITQEEDNILTANVSKPTMRYKSVEEIFDNELKQRGRDWAKLKQVEKVFDLGTRDYKLVTVQYRQGLEDDETRIAEASKIWDESHDMQRTIKKEFKELGSEFKSKYKDDKDYYIKKYAPRYGEKAVGSYEVEGAPIPKITSSVFNFGTKSGGGYSLTPDTEYKTSLDPNTVGSIVISRKTGGGVGGMAIKLSGRILGEKDKPVTNTGGDPIEGMNLTKNMLIGKMWKGAEEIDEKASDRLINKETGEPVDKLTATMTAGVYEELASGEKRKVIYKNGRYWITSPMTPQTVKINLNEGENRKNVYQQMMTAVNWQGTYDDFVKYINDKLSVVKSVSTKQESISKEDNTSGSVADRWKNKYKR